MSNAIREALRLGFDTVQVFVKNQRQWAGAPLAPPEVAAWRALLQTPGFGPPVAHASYLINLASGDEDLRRRSRDAFADELLRCQALAIPSLVVHPGAAGDQPRETAIARVALSLDEIHAAHPELSAMTLLELTAGQGSALGARVEELAAIIDRVGRPARVGICVDTCHAFAAGYDIRTSAGYEALIGAIDAKIGLARLRCWHLNDSRGALGSRLDRHEHIGRGQLGDDGFRFVLADERFAGVPMILETAKDEAEAGVAWDTVNLARLREIACSKRSGGRGTRSSRAPA